jgi:hypothetical protein
VLLQSGSRKVSAHKMLLAYEHATQCRTHNTMVNPAWAFGGGGLAFDQHHFQRPMCVSASVWSICTMLLVGTSRVC